MKVHSGYPKEGMQTENGGDLSRLTSPESYTRSLFYGVSFMD